MLEQGLFCRISLGGVMALLACLAASANAATLNVSGGQLLGASGVLVDGNEYDVEFIDGSCIGVFSGCDEPSDFTFTDGATTALASQALLDQVFLDGGSGNFDSEPWLTNGCTNLVRCNIFTPYEINGTFVSAGWVQNFVAEASDDSLNTVMLVGSWYDLTGNTNSVYAKWYAVIPEPNTATLLALGLVGMAAKRRRARAPAR